MFDRGDVDPFVLLIRGGLEISLLLSLEEHLVSLHLLLLQCECCAKAPGMDRRLTLVDVGVACASWVRIAFSSSSHKELVQDRVPSSSSASSFSPDADKVEEPLRSSSSTSTCVTSCILR